MLLLIILFSNNIFSQANKAHQIETIYDHNRLLDTLTDEKTKTTYFIHQSWNYLPFDTDSALSFSDSALHYSKINDNYLLAKALSIRGEIFRRTGLYDSALFYQQESILLRDSNDYSGLRYNYIEIGDVYKSIGFYHLAQVNYNKAMEMVRNIGKSIVLKNHNDYKHLQPHLINASEDFHPNIIELRNKLKEVARKFKINGDLMPFYLFNYLEVNQRIADIYFILKDYQKSLNRYEDVKNYFSIYYKTKFFNIVNISHQNYLIDYAYKLGRNYFYLNMIDSARRYADLAITAAEHKPDSLILANSYKLQGDISFYKNNYQDFYINFEKAQSTFNNLKYINLEAELIADKYLKILSKKLDIDYQNSISELDYALNLIKYSNNLDVELKLYDCIYKINKNFKKLDNALYFNELKYIIMDSISNKEYATQLAEQQEILNLNKLKDDLNTQKESYGLLNDKYQLSIYGIYLMALFVILISIIVYVIYINKKKLEILNKQITVQSERINEITENKQELFSLLAHDIKSPVLLTSRAIEVLKNNNLSTERKNEYYEQIEDILSRLQILINNILNWVGSETGEMQSQIEHIDLFEFITDRLILFNDKMNNKKIEIDLEIHEMIINIDIISFGVIVDNIINNAIKFSDYNSKFSIHLINSKLHFINYGVEFDIDQIKDINNNKRTYSKLGTNNEKGTGLGLKIITNLSKKNNISVLIESEGKLSKVILDISKK